MGHSDGRNQLYSSTSHRRRCPSDSSGLGDGIRQFGIHGRGVHPLPDDAEEVEDPLTDMLSKSATDPGPDPRGGGGDSQVVHLP